MAKNHQRILTDNQANNANRISRNSHRIGIVEHDEPEYTRIIDISERATNRSTMLTRKDIQNLVFNGHFGEGKTKRFMCKMSPKALCAVFLMALNSNTSDKAERIKAALLMTQKDETGVMSLSEKDCYTLRSLRKSDLLDEEAKESVSRTVKAITNISTVDNAFSGTVFVGSAITLGCTLIGALTAAPILILPIAVFGTAAISAEVFFFVKHIVGKAIKTSALNKKALQTVNQPKHETGKASEKKTGASKAIHNIVKTLDTKTLRKSVAPLEVKDETSALQNVNKSVDYLFIAKSQEGCKTASIEDRRNSGSLLNMQRGGRRNSVNIPMESPKTNYKKSSIRTTNRDKLESRKDLSSSQVRLIMD